MKILLSDTTYSYLFPGGKQVHAEKIFTNLKELNVDVEFENWHDPNLKGDIIHFFGYNDFNKIKALKKKGYKLVYTHILDGLTNLSKTKLRYHELKNKLIRKLPERFNVMFPWKALNLFDAIIYMHDNDRNTAVKLYNVDQKKTYVIPHAVDSLDNFKGEGLHSDEKYLVSLGSIIPRKNLVFTAEICRKNNIPIKFIGHPFDRNSDYFKKFIENTDSTCVEYLDFLSEKEKINVLKGASGFILLSFGESGCISVYEAAATGLPLLLSDLPWAKGYEKPNDLHFTSPMNSKIAEQKIIDFYANSKKQLEPTFEVHTWKEIATLYNEIYFSVL